MSEERSARSGGRPSGQHEPRTRADRSGDAAMRARTWAIAYHYFDPADYDIPPVPEWTVCRTERGLGFAERPAAEPFITAERPTKVRR